MLVDYNKVFACYGVEIVKYTLKNVQIGGRAPGAPALDQPLSINQSDNMVIVSKRIKYSLVRDVHRYMLSNN